MAEFKSFDSPQVSFDIRKDPFAGIQWKGTDVCMDVHCECGHHSHIDCAFSYFVRCPMCNAVYECNPRIQLIRRPEMDDDEEELTIKSCID